ncbi:MAG: cytochrome c [Verrucomicrobium sp.]|nr:cytochrome c [Verrucomicrobium sp.]
MNAPRPVPLWFALAYGFLALWALGYLLFYNGDFRADVYEEEGPAPDAAETAADPVALGKTLYARNCAVCHQPDGQGLPGYYPPLAGSPFVLRQEGRTERQLARIVLGGLVEPVIVRGHAYNGTMTPWGELLTDTQIAAVLTYAGQAWGNAAPPVASETVAAARRESAGRDRPWTVGELEKIR